MVTNIVNREYNRSKIYSIDAKYIDFKHPFGNHIYIEPIIHWEFKFIVHWAISYAQGVDRTMNLIIRTLFERNSTIHSDRGYRYSSNEYNNSIKEKGFTKFLSQKGNGLDNRESENWFGILQAKLLAFIDTRKMYFQELKEEIGKFIY